MSMLRIGRNRGLMDHKYQEGSVCYDATRMYYEEKVAKK